MDKPITLGQPHLKKRLIASTSINTTNTPLSMLKGGKLSGTTVTKNYKRGYSALSFLPRCLLACVMSVPG